MKHLIFSLFLMSAIVSNANTWCAGWSGSQSVAPCSNWSDGLMCTNWSGSDPVAPCAAWSNKLTCTEWSGSDTASPCAKWSIPLPVYAR